MNNEIVTSYERNNKTYVILEINGEPSKNSEATTTESSLFNFHTPVPNPIPNRIAESRYVTDKWDKKRGIEDGGWIVAYGREVTETDFAIGAVETFFGGPAGLTAWINQIISESISKLSESVQKKLTTEVKEAAINFAFECLQGLIKGKSLGETLKDIGDIGFKAGVVKYSGENQVRALGSGWNTISTTLSYQPYVGIKI